MAEAVMIDFSLPEEVEKKNPSVKRKRDNQIPMSVSEREAKIRALNEELQSLMKYFKELASEDGVAAFKDSHFQSCSSTNVNAMIAVLLEEKDASYSKLSSEILERLKDRDNTVTIASVKSNVINIGRRVCYGVQINEGDILEDETESCLWCWETREMKLLPAAIRGALKVRRTCRKKISERITAISAVLSLLQNPMECQSYNNDLRKASNKLFKVLNEADIRLVAQSSTKVESPELADKGAKREEKLLIKQLEQNKREEEKEKKRRGREHQKEMLRSEKELRRLQEEAERDEKRREKEDSEMKKQLKRKQEELEKDQRRREKEEAEKKKQRTIQKQASIMQRFLHLSKNNSASRNDQAECNAATSDLSNQIENTHEPATLLMDSTLFQNSEIDTKDIRKSHLDSWRRLGRSSGQRIKHWGIRQKPKSTLINEIKLTAIKEAEQDDEFSIGNPVGRSEGAIMDEKAFNTNFNTVIRKGNRSKQLLQFDKTHRPAFYGVWPKKSHAVGPRNPFKQDPELDYDIDSDEEWEEEEPGESLSECEKDEDDENLEDGSIKADDEDESGDGFFVPDGYLSENEGIQSDQSPCNTEKDDAELSLNSYSGAESEEVLIWARQLKHLHTLTEHALRKNQPVIISNTMHQKAHLLSSDNLTGTPKVEQICLQALTMRPFPDGLTVEVPSDETFQNDSQETCTPTRKCSLLPAGTMTAIPDSELPIIVSVIRSCPFGMNKLLEALLNKFPNSPKAQLRNKVRQISDFVDNRWKVKKEILDKLGVSENTPEKLSTRVTNIAAFFSKRCMPPSGRHSEAIKTSPEPAQKTVSSQSDSQQMTGLPKN